MTVNETVLHVAHSPWVKLILPRWFGRLRKSWEDVFVACDELQVRATFSIVWLLACLGSSKLYVKEIMAERRAETTQREHFDLLSGLMDAAEKDPDDKMRITEDEMYCASRRAVVDPILTSPLSQLCCDAVCVVVAQRCCDDLTSCSLNSIAGHETSAHSLSFVLGELAANPEVQARLHQHILDNLPERGVMPV